MCPAPRSMTRTLAARLAVLTVTANLAMAGGLGAQVPLGPEFRVNTYTTGTQRFRSISGSPSGVFVVTWESAGQDGSQYGVFAQRYLNFSAFGGEFQVNAYTTSDQHLPTVATDDSGNFVVVWQSEGQDGDGHGVFGQRFAGWGPPFGGEFRVNSFTTLAQGYPDMAASGAGFVVVWQSAGQDGSDYGIFGQRYSDEGVPLGTEFRVNTYTTGAQRAPSVACDPSGSFVVTWEGESADDQLLGIHAQRFSNAGVPLGAEFRVNSYTPGNQRSPAVEKATGGQFTIVWQSDGQDGSADGVFGQRYSAAGFPTGPEFRVNTYITSMQSSPELNMSNRVTILWESDLQDGSGTGIYAQQYFDGIPSGPEFRVNTYTAGLQTGPAMAYTNWPHWISPWTGPQDADGSLGVYALRWDDLPVELQTFVVE